MKSILLDTNAYSKFLLGDETVLNTIIAADNTFMSIFVLAELYYGFKNGSKEKQNKEYLSRFLKKRKVKVIPGTEETANYFALIKHSLKTSGTSIPLNDVWIAAHAMELGAELITFDNHFKVVPGLRLWDYM